MAENLIAGIVQILAEKGAVAGTGFIVTPQGLVATCAHVVQATGAALGGRVRVAFHGTRQEAWATVVEWRSPDQEDVALLQIEADLVSAVSVLPLGESEGCAGHSFTAFGYPELGEVEGVWASGTITGAVQSHGGVALLQLASPELDRGASGGPVWDRERGCVVGMVTAVYYPDASTKKRDAALATPVETLKSVCPAIPVAPVPLREMIAARGGWRFFIQGRNWRVLWHRLWAMVRRYPMRGIVSGVALLSLLAALMFGGRAFLNRGWQPVTGGPALLGTADDYCSVSVAPFEIQVTEVTNAAYLQCVRAEVCAPPASTWKLEEQGWTFPQGKGRHPVWGLRWEDADAYCRFIGARLPTEAEWVRAARQGTTRLFPWGGEFDVARLNVYETDIGDTVTVRAYSLGRSAEGVYQLCGNVREWVSDRALDPCYVGAGEGEHVAKGGAFKDSFESVTLWTRFQSNELPFVGVRCAR